MKVQSPDLHIADVVRVFHDTGHQTVYGVWSPSDIKKKTFSLHESEPDNTLVPSQIILEVSDGRRFVVDQPISYAEQHGEHGLAWMPVRGRPTLRTQHGPKASIPFIEDSPEPTDAPRPGRWWSR